MKIAANHTVQNIDSVLKKRLNGAIADERVFIYKIKKMLKTQKSLLTILPNPVSTKSLHVAVSKRNPRHKEIVAAFNKALATMKGDGSYLKIIKSHDANELNW